MSSSLAAEVGQFEHHQLQTYQDWYEALPYTAYISHLSTSGEPIFTIQNLAKDTGQHESLALLSKVGATRTSDVYLHIDGPHKSRRVYTQSLPSGLTPFMAGSDDGERSASKLGLRWANNTGSTVTDQQANYVGALKRLTTADKVMRGHTLTTSDKHLQKKYQIHNQGLRPLTIREMQDRIWRRAILDEDVFSAVVDVGTSETDIPRFTVPSGQVYIVHSLAASIPSGDVGNRVVLKMDRDSQVDHVQVLLDNAPGMDHPWDMWMSARHDFRIKYMANTSTSSVAIRVGWYRVKVTGLISVVMGQSSVSDLSKEEQSIYEKLLAGVIA